MTVGSKGEGEWVLSYKSPEGSPHLLEVTRLMLVNEGKTTLGLPTSDVTHQRKKFPCCSHDFAIRVEGRAEGNGRSVGGRG